MVGLVAFVIALVGVLAALGHVGYLAMLNNAAKKRGISGAPVSDFASKKLRGAAVTGGVAVLGLLIVAGGGVPADIFGMLLAGGAGLVGAKELRGTQERFRTQL